MIITLIRMNGLKLTLFAGYYEGAFTAAADVSIAAVTAYLTTQRPCNSIKYHGQEEDNESEETSRPHRSRQIDLLLP